MQRWILGALALAAVTAAGVTLRATQAQPEIRTAPRELRALVSDLRLTLTRPPRGARAETRWVRVEGRVEATGVRPARARVELGVLQEREYWPVKTISVPVGAAFSEMMELPGDGPYTVYAGVVQLVSVVRVEDVAVRPPAGRDLGRGSHLSAQLRLADQRGRLMDGRIVVSQGGSIIGETHSSAGRALLYDLAPGEYVVNATSPGGLESIPTTIRVRSDYAAVYIIGFVVPEG